MTRRLRHLVRPTRPLLAAAILAALTLPASPAAAETGATNAPAPAVAAPAPVSAETAPRVFAVAGPAPGSSSAETERPFPCNTETGGYHRVRYQTLFDPLRIYFLGRNCSETDSVNARIRHLGYPSYPDRIVCVGPMQSVFHGVQVGRPNQPWEPWDYTYGVGCDQDPPEMGVPTPPLPPPTGPVPPPPPPTCPPDEPTAPWCGQDPTPPVVNVTGTVTAPVNSAEPRGRAVEEQRPLSWANYEMRYKKRNGQWEMLRQGPGNTGDPVRGHLNAAGEFEVEFVYPQD
ncbi:hypothetical protein, partial [Streptosporangium sp. OZ121]|uniref:hypothetical protein n=1 Tax=Streptosporangium sp. OZ121 TaxID=3444183 RepID=UPI003F79219C